MKFSCIVLRHPRGDTVRHARRILFSIFVERSCREEFFSLAPSHRQLVNTALPANFPLQDDLRETRFARVFPRRAPRLFLWPRAASVPNHASGIGEI